MLRVVIIRPGSTDFDEQGRIKGTLDIPLSPKGLEQMSATAAAMAEIKLDVIYCAPCQSAKESAAVLAKPRKLKVKEVEAIRNVDLGLWHGKLVEEVKTKQPKVYRQWQEQPGSCCPPDGEPMSTAMVRVQEGLTKLMRKHKQGTVALVLPEPVASLARSHFNHATLGDLWKCESLCGSWEILELAEAVKPAAKDTALVWRGVPTE